MIRYTIFINDNVLYLQDKKRQKIYSQKFLNLQFDNITNEQNFRLEFNKFICKNKIKISLFGYKALFIKTQGLSSFMIDKYHEIFFEYFKSIKTISIMELLNKNKTIINITDNYLDFYYKNKHLRINNGIFEDEIAAIKHFNNNICKSKELLFFGNRPDLPIIVCHVNESLGLKSFYNEEYKHYIFNEFNNKNG